MNREHRKLSWYVQGVDERASAASCLTFDMSGDRKHAQRAVGRPLDGGVRCHCSGRTQRSEEACRPKWGARRSVWTPRV